MAETLRVGLIIEPAGWHLTGIVQSCAAHPEVGPIAIADATGETFGEFRSPTGSSTDPDWRAKPHEPGSGPLPGWTKLSAPFNTPAVLGDKLQGTYTDHAQMLAELPEEAPVEELPVFRLGEDPSVFRVDQEDDGWRVRGVQVERLAAITVWNLDEAVARFQQILERMGVVQALEEAGVQPGDIVRLGEREMVWED